jgi:hypothetical protein
MRGIQYAVTFVRLNRRLRLLDHPLSRMMTTARMMTPECYVDNRRPHFTTAAVCPNNSLRSSSVRIAGWPKFGLTSLALA